MTGHDHLLEQTPPTLADLLPGAPARDAIAALLERNARRGVLLARLGTNAGIDAWLAETVEGAELPDGRVLTVPGIADGTGRRTALRTLARDAIAAYGRRAS